MARMVSKDGVCEINERMLNIAASLLYKKVTERIDTRGEGGRGEEGERTRRRRGKENDECRRTMYEGCVCLNREGLHT